MRSSSRFPRSHGRGKASCKTRFVGSYAKFRKLSIFCPYFFPSTLFVRSAIDFCALLVFFGQGNNQGGFRDAALFVAKRDGYGAFVLQHKTQRNIFCFPR